MEPLLPLAAASHLDRFTAGRLHVLEAEVGVGVVARYVELDLDQLTALDALAGLDRHALVAQALLDELLALEKKIEEDPEIT